MELRHLLALDAVLATGSFTQAAAARHVSQPTLWAQVKELERELGLALFVRTGRGVAPTAACRALRPRLDVALADVTELRRAATRIREGREAPARIGCAPSHVSHFLASAIAELVTRDPQTPFPVILPVTTASATETLERGGIDLLVEPRVRPSGVDAVVLYDIALVALGPAATSARERLDVRALAGHPIATLPSDSLARRQLDAACAVRGIALRVVHESRDAGALVALARSGLATAVLHDEMIDADTAQRVSPLVGRSGPLTTPLWLAWRPEESLSPAAIALRDVMRRRARGRARAARRGSRG